MNIKKEDIEHIAKLSMLNLSETEIEKYRASMEEIVGFANKINELDTDGIEESAFASNMCNVFRKDEVKESFDRDELLKNAPSSNGEAYSLPSMME
jgi:aspartyl-tRNA(Asn)/glutamyl-tRNA(Gln) amidotransferase subunit C